MRHMPPPLGPYSRSLTALDGRTKAARLLKDARAELLALVGGTPTQQQKMLIETASQILLRIKLMDAKLAVTGEQTECDSRTYLAWSNSYRRAVARLGLPPVDAPHDPLGELNAYLASKGAVTSGGL